MAYVRVRYYSDTGDFDCVDAVDNELADECEGCNMDDEVVYEIDLIKISHVKMPLKFANEYDPYDRKFGKGMLKNNDSLLADTVDTFNTFQKVITAPEVVRIDNILKPDVMKPTATVAASAPLKSKKQYYFSNGTPVRRIFHTAERTYVNEDGITVYEKPTTAKDWENLRRIIAEVKAENLKSEKTLNK